MNTLTDRATYQDYLDYLDDQELKEELFSYGDYQNQFELDTDEPEFWWNAEDRDWEYDCD